MRFSAGWLSAGVAALLLTAGCEEGRSGAERREGEQATASQIVEQAKEKSEQAFEQAREAQEQASDEQREAAQAQQEVLDAQQRLMEARATAQREAQEAQQAQQQAQQQIQQAQQQTQQAQQSALEAQRQQQSELARQNQQQQAQQAQQAAQAHQQAQQVPPPVAQAPAPSTQAQEQFISGDVLTVNDQEVLVSTRGEPQLRLQLQPGTVIMVDGRQARATDIEEGSQVRASYRHQGGEPTATRIEVTTSQKPATPAAPNSGESSPGFPQQ